MTIDTRGGVPGRLFVPPPAVFGTVFENDDQRT